MRENTVRGPAIDLGEFERRLRGPERRPADSVDAKADPLSELARLMQGEEAVEADPYSRILADSRAARAPTPELRPSYEPQPDPRQYVEAPRVDPAYPQQGYAPQQAGYADQPEPTYQGAEGSWGDDSQYLDYGAEDDGRYDEPRGFRRFLKPWHVVAGISAIAVVSIAWGFLHRSGADGNRDIATITAPEGPVKVKPSAEADAGAPPTGAAVLDRKDPPAVKQIVTSTEQAVDPTVAPKTLKLGAGRVDAPHEPAPLGAQPRKVKTVTVRPDGSRVDDAPLPPAVAKAANPPAAAPDPMQAKGGTPQATAKPATTPKATKPKTPARVASAEEPAAAAAAPSDDAAVAAPIAKGGYAVQFGAATSEAEAKALVKTVSAKYGSQLGGAKPGFKSATVGDKTVFRVRVGGLSKDSATAICGKVKAGGGNCFVAAN